MPDLDNDDRDPAEQGKHGERDSPWKGTEDLEREQERGEPERPQGRSER